MSDWRDIATAKRPGRRPMILGNWYRGEWVQHMGYAEPARNGQVRWVTEPGHWHIFPTHWHPDLEPPERPEP